MMQASTYTANTWSSFVYRYLIDLPYKRVVMSPDTDRYHESSCILK